MRELKITLQDVLLLIDCNGDSDEQIIIAEEADESTWSTMPLNSKLLWIKENLERKVESISIWEEKFQIFLADEKREKKLEEL